MCINLLNIDATRNTFRREPAQNVCTVRNFGGDVALLFSSRSPMLDDSGQPFFCFSEATGEFLGFMPPSFMPGRLQCNGAGNVYSFFSNRGLLTKHSSVGEPVWERSIHDLVPSETALKIGVMGVSGDQFILFDKQSGKFHFFDLTSWDYIRSYGPLDWELWPQSGMALVGGWLLFDSYGGRLRGIDLERGSESCVELPSSFTHTEDGYVRKEPAVAGIVADHESNQIFVALAMDESSLGSARDGGPDMRYNNASLLQSWNFNTGEISLISFPGMPQKHWRVTGMTLDRLNGDLIISSQWYKQFPHLGYAGMQVQEANSLIHVVPRERQVLTPVTRKELSGQGIRGFLAN